MVLIYVKYQALDYTLVELPQRLNENIRELHIKKCVDIVEYIKPKTKLDR